MTYEIGSVLCGGPGFDALSKNNDHLISIDNRENLWTPCRAYQMCLESSTADALMMVHDDVTIHEEGWQDRVMLPFYDSKVVAVGLGGALGLGHPNLYKQPYRLNNMARWGYMSNQTDAEMHGKRTEGTHQVAVLDAFFMAVRTEWLKGIGGWPVNHISHHCLDLWLACEAARQGRRTYMVGVSCTHHGGGTSTKEAYKNAKWLQGGSLESDHRNPHEWLYQNYRDVLPLKVSE